MSEKEYKELLQFCTEHNLYCLEYHRRHRNQKEEFREEREKQRKRG